MTETATVNVLNNLISNFKLSNAFMPHLWYLYLNSVFFRTCLFITKIIDKKLVIFFCLQLKSLSFLSNQKKNGFKKSLFFIKLCR